MYKKPVSLHTNICYEANKIILKYTGRDPNKKKRPNGYRAVSDLIEATLSIFDDVYETYQKHPGELKALLNKQSIKQIEESQPCHDFFR